MSKHGLQARPLYHHKRESIEAHLTIASRRARGQPLDRDQDKLEHKEIHPHRRYRTIQIHAGRQTVTVDDPLPDDLCEALALMN